MGDPRVLREPQVDIFAPLRQFYSDGELPKPERLEGAQIPQPYRSLLVHERDMTLVLQEHFHATLTLRVLAKRQEPHALRRQVVLITEGDQRVAEFGAILIHTAAFDEEPRALIEQCQRPLGTILQQFGIKHRSNPTGYFRVWSDAVMQDALEQGSAGWLYGRNNSLVHADGRPLAEVVEILPDLDRSV